MNKTVSFLKFIYKIIILRKEWGPYFEDQRSHTGSKLPEDTLLCPTLTVRLFYHPWLLSISTVASSWWWLLPQTQSSFALQWPRDLTGFRNSTSKSLAYSLSNVLHLVGEGQNSIIKKQWLRRKKVKSFTHFLGILWAVPKILATTTSIFWSKRILKGARCLLNFNALLCSQQGIILKPL